MIILPADQHLRSWRTSLAETVTLRTEFSEQHFGELCLPWVIQLGVLLLFFFLKVESGLLLATLLLTHSRRPRYEVDCFLWLKRRSPLSTVVGRRGLVVIFRSISETVTRLSLVLILFGTGRNRRMASFSVNSSEARELHEDGEYGMACWFGLFCD